MSDDFGGNPVLEKITEENREAAQGDELPPGVISR